MSTDDERQRLDQLLDEFARVVDGVSIGRQPVGDFDRLVAALREQVEAVATEEAYETSDSATATVGLNLRRFRNAARWSQQQLADAMSEMGFSWNQVTVTQTEGGERRRANFEELYGLAALFGRPVAEFLIPNGHGLDLNERHQISGRDAAELVVGRGGSWAVAAPVGEWQHVFAETCLRDRRVRCRGRNRTGISDESTWKR